MTWVFMAAVLLVSALSHNCSTERNPVTLPGAHPDSWMNKESSDFHGRFVSLDGTATCQNCHGIETPGGPVGISCMDCHGSGTEACIQCHGGLDNTSGAPPYGLDGETSDTSLAVGAHTVHLEASSLGAAVACNACHLVPVFVFSPRHLDLDPEHPGVPQADYIAEITWHGIADGGGAAWNRSARTCSGTYCHGNFTGGNTANKPVWTGTNQAGCGSCHDIGSDPSKLAWKHVYHIESAGLECYDCHFSVTNAFFNIVNPSLHVNGRADTLIRDPSLCDACHGSGTEACIHCHGGLDNTTGAPPYGLRGETATSQLAVGAHTTHMEGGAVADAFACRDCHAVPLNLFSSGHLGADSIAEITWGPLAGASSAWNHSTGACSNIYCHGNFAGGATGNRPIWTGANQAACGSCHDAGSNPGLLSGRHQKHVVEAGWDCIECHATVVSRELQIVDPGLHVNGEKTVSFLKGGTYRNGSCSGLNNTFCHGSESWYDTR